MKTIIATIVISLSLIVGPFHAASISIAEHVGHGEMTSSVCTILGCSASEMPVGHASAQCINHCLNAATSSALPSVTASFSLILFVAFAIFLNTGFFIKKGREDIASFSDVLQKILTRQRLATVVMRN